jgi:hypothetical protein
MKNRLIVVLGMHRSGTSAVTRGLQVFGVQLGDRLMPPFEGDNEKGFWEDIDINALNIEMLNEIKSDWHNLALIKKEEIEALKKSGFLQRAVELLRVKTSNFPIYGFKDPRLLKLLPFWKEVFNHCQYEVSYILALRHPLSVAKSLAKRNQFDGEKSYLMWLGHVINSLSGTFGCNRILVDYDKLMENPGRELNRIAAALHLNTDTHEFEIYKTEFLDPDLRHTFYQAEDLMFDDTASDLVREVYTTLMDLSAAKRIDEGWLKEKTDQWENEFLQLNTSLTLADKLFKQIVAANQKTEENNQQIAVLHQQLSDQVHLIIQKDEILNQKKKELSLKDEELNQKKEELRIKDEELNQKKEELRFKAEELDQKKEELRLMAEELNQKKVELRLAAEELNYKTEVLSQTVEKLNQKNEELNQKTEILRQKDEEINRLHEELNQEVEELRFSNEELDRKNKALNQKNEELVNKDRELIQKNEELGNKDRELIQKNEELDINKEELNKKYADLEIMSEALDMKKEELKNKNEELNQIVASRSWRITKPFRFIFGLFR